MSTLVKLPNGKRVIASDRARMMGGLGCGCNSLSGLGLAVSGSAGKSLSYASMGAKVGSIVPGVGNIIGAAAGALVGMLGKKKPVRPSGEQVAQCQQLLAEYEKLAATNAPPVGAELGEGQLKDINWCLQAVYGAHYTGTKDPRWFDGSFALNLDLARQTVKAVFNTPVGSTVTVKPTPWKDPKGVLIQSNGFSFVNPQFISLKDLTDNYYRPAVKQVCRDTAGKGAPGCSDYYELPAARRMLLDLLSYAASVELPQVDIEKIKAAEAARIAEEKASQKVAVQPGTSVPLPTPVSSAPQPVQTTPLPVSLAPSLPAPAISTGASTPVSSQDSQIESLVQSLLSQGANQQQAFSSALQTLNARGVAITPDVQNAVAAEVKSAGTAMPKWVWPAAGVAGLLGVFLLTRKRRKS